MTPSGLRRTVMGTGLPTLSPTTRCRASADWLALVMEPSCRMWSPILRPARLAGEPSNTWSTKKKGLRGCGVAGGAVGVADGVFGVGALGAALAMAGEVTLASP